MAVVEVRPWRPENHVCAGPAQSGICTIKKTCTYGAIYSLRIRQASGRLRWFAACEFHRGLAEGRYPWGDHEKSAWSTQRRR